MGGGNSALTSALLLSKFAKKVYIVYRQDKFRKADPAWIDEVKKDKKIEIIFNSEITKLIGGEKLRAIEINNSKEIKTDGLFIEIGSDPNIDLAEKLGLKEEKGYIKVDKFQKTSIKGIFAAGDITNNPLKQVVTATAEGAIAADSAYRELIK
jgi:thioredoxin reductase (NADPH)